MWTQLLLLGSTEYIVRAEPTRVFSTKINAETRYEWWTGDG